MTASWASLLIKFAFTSSISYEEGPWTWIATITIAIGIAATLSTAKHGNLMPADFMDWVHPDNSLFSHLNTAFINGCTSICRAAAMVFAGVTILILLIAGDVPSAWVYSELAITTTSIMVIIAVRSLALANARASVNMLIAFNLAEHYSTIPSPTG